MDYDCPIGTVAELRSMSTIELMKLAEYCESDEPASVNDWRSHKDKVQAEIERRKETPNEPV